MNYGRCRSCKALVIWVEYAKTGKKTCLDADPVHNGNIAIHASGLAFILKKGEAYAGTKYRSHFVSCPDMKTKWKKRK